jgi:hypothetical protein
MPSKSKPSLRIFYSYSHRDAGLRKKLEDHLSLLRREGLVEEWFDGRITAGGNIDLSVYENLGRSDIVLLLISASFLSSNYCWGVEMRAAMKRHQRGAARVIPIIVRPVEDGWKGTIFGPLKALPSDGKPVTKWSNRDSAWADVTNGIREAIMDVCGNKRRSR